jgi:hypothetical protein
VARRGPFFVGTALQRLQKFDGGGGDVVFRRRLSSSCPAAVQPRERAKLDI